MKRKIYTLSSLLLIFISASGQCPFDPLVTPNNMMLCPNTSDTLWTQVYDSYQWYENGNPIPGATNQYYVVSYIMDAGDYFSVEATDSNCTEMSPQVLVDGWAFLPPFVIQEGDQGWFDGLYLHLCQGDTLILILGQPYEVNIQWYMGFNPIPFATNDTLLVTASGSYSVEGAPSICPNFIMQLGISIDVIVHQPVVPFITLVNDTLHANPNATSYQWFFYLNPIPGATNQWYYPTQPGSYTVSVADTNQCTSMSSPFVVTGLEPIRAPHELNIIYDGDIISVENACVNSELKIYDVTGRLKEKFSGKNRYRIPAEAYEGGMYLVTLQCDKETFRKKILIEK